MSANQENNPDIQDAEVDTLADVPENLDEENLDQVGEQPVERDEATRMEHEIELLESQLQEKEDLVFALTERLEQAAEQLDRYRRSGARQKQGGGSLPKEVVEEQKTLFEEMRQMISQWEATQPGATLGRIELQVSELRDLVSGNVLGSSGPIAPAAGQTQNTQSGSGSSLLDALKAASPADKPKPPPQSTEQPQHKPGSWEAQKAALMAGEPLPSAEESAPTETAETQVDEGSSSEHGADAATSEDINDTPTPINFEEADIETLRQAVLERDRIIASLKDRLASGEVAGEPVKYDTMESMPDEFRAKLEALEEEWKEKIRETEVELSLERAKIAREKAEIQQQQHQLQKHREKLGISADAAGGSKSEGHTPEEHNSGRWLRFLKRGNEDD